MTLLALNNWAQVYTLIMIVDSMTQEWTMQMQNLPIIQKLLDRSTSNQIDLLKFKTYMVRR